MNSDLKTTSLIDRHRELGAKLVPFAGYLMPIQYSSIIREHQAVRSAAGLFDVSHMGEFFVTGPEAENYLQYLTINDVSALAPGQAQYSAICNDAGRLLDDLIVYRLGDQEFMVVVNAANIAKDYQWFESHLPEQGVTLENRSDAISLIAFQGPRSRSILSEVLETNLTELPFYSLTTVQWRGRSLTVARTGYTGELGFEIFGDHDTIPVLWDGLLAAGKEAGVLPAGLGARDTLRLEMKYCLYGNDIDETTHPLEAGLGWITKLDKGEFIGRDALREAREHITRRLVCFELQERGIPRHGYDVYSGSEQIGRVTSGGQSPSLGKGIGLAYVARGWTKSGTEIEIDVRGKRLAATVVKPPFYTSGSLHS
ncbi:MAG: glycine cleavage system aminomethyltransferase GcvT [Candidatus Neomarinimicrobiota bacterium]|nr:MAG: glycine cleavage system aminomethyltransferase GcvT [Candidatus Neomarinimicrobiota bacterium]